ncbi:MAG: TlpA family protein disulfide reductase [Acidimicrobiia bacterium]|nr:TlpA family protein disulfide reductase [Acidimicrobiia bacterium]MDH3396691.1 TlpA family protein disulfide reductase [Acidimicrobiia bacterium]
MPTRRPIAALAVLLVFLTSCTAQQSQTVGPPLPDTNAAEVVALLEASSQPVVINVWASWCIPCRSEAPLIERANEQFGDDIRFIGINVADTQSGARQFIAEFGLSFENLFDAPRTVPAALGGSGVPVTFFFAPGGSLVHYQPGVIDERTLALQIDELLKRHEDS